MTFFTKSGSCMIKKFGFFIFFIFALIAISVPTPDGSPIVTAIIFEFLLIKIFLEISFETCAHNYLTGFYTYLNEFLLFLQHQLANFDFGMIFF